MAWQKKEKKEIGVREKDERWWPISEREDSKTKKNEEVGWVGWVSIWRTDNKKGGKKMGR